MSQHANDMRDLRDDAARLGRDAAASGQRLAEDARAELARLRAQVERLMEDRVTPALGTAADTVEDYSRRARQTIEDNAYAVADTVRERPLLTIAAAAIGGYILGRLMGGTTYVYPDRHHR
ncbi:hypothetical protein [Falsiroseomonas sp. CW058]|uniref:hypothetical protein n=1 Tax=Falsiroseomonas sp. CW058 TaxID=3388664 RepID=UPI003D31A4CB